MTQPPIVPGTNPVDPTEPIPVSPPAYPPQQYAPAPQAPAWNPGRAAGNTVVVVMTLVGIFVGLPLLCCAGLLLFGAFTGAGR